MKIFLIEDDLDHAEHLQTQILDLGGEVIGPFSENVEAMEALKKTAPDIVVSSILEESDTFDGMEIARRAKNTHDTPFIFIVKNYDKSILKKAKSLRPDYLLNKWPLKDQLGMAIDLAFYIFNKRNSQNQNSSPIGTDQLPDPFFFVKRNGKYLRILVNEISHLKAAGSQTEIFSEDSRYVVSSNLGDVLKQISNENTLIQCHRSYAVNLFVISSFDNHSIYVKNNGKEIEIPIGESFRKNVFDKIKILKSK